MRIGQTGQTASSPGQMTAALSDNAPPFASSSGEQGTSTSTSRRTQAYRDGRCSAWREESLCLSIPSKALLRAPSGFHGWVSLHVCPPRGTLVSTLAFLCFPVAAPLAIVRVYCLLPFACCCWMLLNHCSVVLALEIVVAVGEVDRRVLSVHVAEEVGGVVLITCVWSWVAHSARHPTPASGLAGVFPEASSHRCCRR